MRRASDPVTGEPYGYRIVDSTSYELTATFDTVDSTVEWTADYREEPRFWRHGAGQRIYRLTVTPHAPERQPPGAVPPRPPGR